MKPGVFCFNLTGAILTGWLLALSGCRPPSLGPTRPSGYRIILPAASQTVRLQPLLLTVQVTDTDGLPVDDVPVHFRIPQNGATRAEVDPSLVMTRQGRASSTFRARIAGPVTVEITVENLTQTVRISVLGEAPRF